MTVPLNHFEKLREFSFGDSKLFNHLYNQLTPMYKLKYSKDGRNYTLKDSSPESFSETLYKLKALSLIDSLNNNGVLLRPIFLPVSNELSMTIEIKAATYAFMLKTNDVIQTAVTRLVREGEICTISKDTITHRNIQTKGNIVGAYIKAILVNGDVIISYAHRAKLDEMTYRTNHLCYGGIVDSSSESRELNNAIFFYFLKSMVFPMASLGKVPLLLKIDGLQGILSELFLQRQRFEDQARFLHSSNQGTHDRVLLKINQTDSVSSRL